MNVAANEELNGDEYVPKAISKYIYLCNLYTVHGTSVIEPIMELALTDAIKEVFPLQRVHFWEV